MGTRTYTASEPIYLSSEGRMVYADEKFSVPSSTKPGRTWLDENGDPIVDTVEDDPLDHDDDGKKGGSEPHSPPALSGKSKAELIAIGVAESVAVTDEMTIVELKTAIETARAAALAAANG